MNKIKILVTGSCGFILGNFIRKVIYSCKDQYDVVSLDKVQNNAINSLYNNKNHTFHIADIRDQHVMDVIFQFEKPDIVIHGAAETFVDSSLKDPNAFTSANVVGTQNVINSCVKYGVKKLIYISTDEVYGQLTSESETAWDENAPLNPRNPYAATKAAGELLVKAAYHTHGLIYNITRSSNNYGPRQFHEKLVPKVIKCIEDGKQIPIYGQGLQIRDWTHVFDNCAAILSILNNGSDNEIYNISANQELPNIEVIQKICNVMGRGHELITHIEDPRGTGHDFRYSVNSNKLRNLGWKPSFKFKDGIKETCEWYMSNKWFIK
jgi:dTDP-glucose 4,6-dehydratase